MFLTLFIVMAIMGLVVGLVRKSPRLWVASLVLIVLVSGLYLLVNDDIDKCLDAGGAWDKIHETCMHDPQQR